MAILKRWMDETILKETPKSKLGKAINYALNRWTELNVYLADGRFEISNNLIENLIRPVAVGRKNWLFGGSPNGAKRTALFFTLFGSCKVNNLDPMEYLLDISVQMSELEPTHENLRMLLPWNYQPKPKPPDS